MHEHMLLVTLGCSRLPGILGRARRHPFVVFGTMDREALAGLADVVSDAKAPALPVYFYESG